MTIAVSLQQPKVTTPQKLEEQYEEDYVYSFSDFQEQLSQKIQQGLELSGKEIKILKKTLEWEWKEKQNKIWNQSVEICTTKLFLTLIFLLMCANVSKDILTVIGVCFWIQCFVIGMEFIMFLVLFQRLWCQRKKVKSECKAEEIKFEGDFECKKQRIFDLHEKSDTEKLKMFETFYSEEVEHLDEKMRLLYIQKSFIEKYGSAVIIIYMWIFSAQLVIEAVHTGNHKDIRIASAVVFQAVIMTVLLTVTTLL